MRSTCIVAFFFCLFSWNLSAQQSIRFTPTTYSHVFSSRPAPVLRINPGDTVHTTSVDAGGFDQYGKSVTGRGNPLTGPFYIEGAQPGDVLAITLANVRLNRNYATTLNMLIPKLSPKPKAAAMKTWRSAKLIRWELNLTDQTGRPMDTTMRLSRLAVPLHPFLGCVGVAPPGDKEIPTGASGLSYGGNLDFRYNTSGATVYLPVSHPGALLYLGDAHAAQGDGELNGDALETSMNFSFTVRVLKATDFPLQTPMVENADHLMFFGIESSFEKSCKVATQALQSWLQAKYNLSIKEASQVIGSAVQYRIPKIAATIVEVVAMIPKEVLAQLSDVGN